MAKDKTTITIDEKEYLLEDLSKLAKEQLENLQFVDTQLNQLQNEVAVADTARIGYTKALEQELVKIKPSDG